MTWDEVRVLALALPGVEDAVSYGTPALKVRVGAKLKLLARLKEDGESVVLFMEPEEKELLLEAEPAVFFQTPHYVGWPSLLARLEALDAERLGPLLERTWRRLANAKLLARRVEAGAPSR